MSAEHYDWIRGCQSMAHRTSNTATVVISTVERAEMDPEHAAVDELLKVSSLPVFDPNVAKQQAGAREKISRIECYGRSAFEVAECA
jgi:hypothetical protein